jgi:hypothetical protein
MVCVISFMLLLLPQSWTYPFINIIFHIWQSIFYFLSCHFFCHALVNYTTFHPLEKVSQNIVSTVCNLIFVCKHVSLLIFHLLNLCQILTSLIYAGLKTSVCCPPILYIFSINPVFLELIRELIPGFTFIKQPQLYLSYCVYSSFFLSSVYHNTILNIFYAPPSSCYEVNLTRSAPTTV